MYPLIMLLFAGGTISAILLSSSESYINYIFAIVAYFIPIFLIGATYKFAGGHLPLWLTSLAKWAVRLEVVVCLVCETKPNSIRKIVVGA
jgi:hypothetical protein